MFEVIHLKSKRGLSKVVVVVLLILLVLLLILLIWSLTTNLIRDRGDDTLTNLACLDIELEILEITRNSKVQIDLEGNREKTIDVVVNRGPGGLDVDNLGFLINGELVRVENQVKPIDDGPLLPLSSNEYALFFLEKDFPPKIEKVEVAASIVLENGEIAHCGIIASGTPDQIRGRGGTINEESGTSGRTKDDGTPNYCGRTKLEFLQGTQVYNTNKKELKLKLDREDEESWTVTEVRFLLSGSTSGGDIELSPRLREDVLDNLNLDSDNTKPIEIIFGEGNSPFVCKNEACTELGFPEEVIGEEGYILQVVPSKLDVSGTIITCNAPVHDSLVSKCRFIVSGKPTLCNIAQGYGAKEDFFISPISIYTILTN